MGALKLLGTWGSPFSHRVEIALKLKGIEYEYIEQDLANKSPLLIESNPVHKTVPVLLHNGKPICESVIILEYIDETWKGTPILPRDPYEKAMARFWANFLDEKCLPALWKACGSKEKEQEKAIEEASELLKLLEGQLAQLKNKKFFGGDTVGLVDIVATLIAHWVRILMEVAGIELLTDEKFPILCNWFNECVNCAAVKENLPDREKLMPFFTAKQQSPAGPPKY